MNFIILWGILLALSLSFSLSSGKDLDCGYQNVLNLNTSEYLSEKSTYGEFPWMVEVLRENYPFQVSMKTYQMIGGGALLSSKIVLTTAHLIKEIKPQYILARAGEWDRSESTERFPHQDRRVEEIIIHEQFSLYGNARYTNDIAFLILVTPFVLEDANIRPICLATRDEDLDHSSCYVTGWGKKTMRSPTNEMVLKKIQLPIVPYNECVEHWKRFVSNSLILDQTLMCAGGELGIDSCNGDGGSPLVCLIKNTTQRYAVVGLVVTSQNCGMKDLPGLYTNVQHFGSWIYDKLGSRGHDFSSFLILET